MAYGFQNDRSTSDLSTAAYAFNSDRSKHPLDGGGDGDSTSLGMPVGIASSNLSVGVGAEARLHGALMTDVTLGDTLVSGYVGSSQAEGDVAALKN